MRKHILILITFLLGSSLWSQQTDSLPSSPTIIEKQFTIPIEERLDIRSIKKIPRYQTVIIAPEINPIFYDKVKFYRSLNIKKRKSLEELFGYPILNGSLWGGFPGQAGGLLNFQVNGKRFIPSMVWKMDYWKNKENVLSTNSYLMDFQGGMRVLVNPSFSFEVNGFYNISNNEIPGSLMTTDSISGVLDNKADIVSTNLLMDFTQADFEIHTGIGYTDIKSSLINEMNTTHLQLNLDGNLQFPFGTLWSSVQASNINYPVPDSIPNKTEDGNLFEGKIGLRVGNNTLSASAGLGFKSDDRLFNRTQQQFYPVVNVSWSVIPSKWWISADYSSGYEIVPVLDNLTFTNYGMNQTRIFNSAISALQVHTTYQPNKNVSASFSLSRKTFDRFHIFSPDSSVFYRYAITDQDLNYYLLSFLISWSPMENLKLNASGSRLELNADSEMNHLPIIPLKSIQLAAFYSIQKIKFQGSLDFTGDRYQDTNSDNILESFADAHIGVGYQWNKHLAFWISARNVFDTTIEPFPGVYLYGRQINANIKWSF